MNLIDGQRMDSQKSQEILPHLEERLARTLESGRLSPSVVIGACDRLVHTLEEERYLRLMEQMGIGRALGTEYLRTAKQLFSREYLETRLRRELGEACLEARRYTPPGRPGGVTERRLPLGVLLHIAAGNADALPAFTVLEGLLTGNINLLKLPEAEGGASILLLEELLRAEPSLIPYVYVFDYSSKDVKSMARLIQAADAVVVWGGDAAVSALRRLVGPDTRLIEWGHKVSFAYVTARGWEEGQLDGLAAHLCATDQLLCSSCQGIYLDTDQPERLEDFCRRFLPVLERHAGAKQDSLGLRSQVSLQLYTEELEQPYKGSRLFRGRRCSLLAYPDSRLEPSLQFRNCWVRPLPRGRIVETLRPYKNHLQTVGLLCGPEEREALADRFWRTGVVRVTSGAEMSATYCGAAHDGEYALQRYTKLASLE